MILLLQINCIKRDGNFVTEITGLVAPQSSDKQPESRTLRAIDQPFDIRWRRPNVGDAQISIGETIKQHTQIKIKYFLVPDPSNPSKNLLENLPLCK